MRLFSDLLAAVMLLVAAYCALRLVLSFSARRATQRDTDLVHVVMGVSMAGMLAPSLAAGPTDLWLLVFAGSTAWFGWRVLRVADREGAGSHPLSQHMPHLLMSGAMVYMFVVAAWSTSSAAVGGFGGMSMAGMKMSVGGVGAARWPLLTVALAVLLFGDGAVTFGRSLRQVAGQPAPVPWVAGAETASSAVPSSSLALDVRSTASPQTVTPPALAWGPVTLAPRSAMVCQLVMSLVMGYMLVSLL